MITATTTPPPTYPENWQIARDFNPNDHLMQLKGKDYLTVQHRLLWFIRDQRELIVRGLGTVPYRVETECVELDRANGWAHFRTYVRDVLGNDATMYGSESVKDFADYVEKASTKSLGRALLALGYGTAFAPEMDEGTRIVDSPVARRSGAATTSAATGTATTTAASPRTTTTEAAAHPKATGRATGRSAGTASQADEQVVISEAEVNAFHRACEAAQVKWRDVVLWVPDHAGHPVTACTKAELRRLYEILRTDPHKFAETDNAPYAPASDNSAATTPIGAAH